VDGQDKPGHDEIEKGVPQARELKIFSDGAMRPLLRELMPRFERAHAVAVEVDFRLSAVLKRAVQGGAPFDLVVLPRPELDELIACGAR
jgi:ABC-type molybdate transport system substrate-binding protein